MYIDICVEPRF